MREKFRQPHLQEQTPTAPSDLWLTPDAVIAAMAKDGDPVPTGWAPLDSRLRRGGVPPGRVISIGGPPFAGKTTIVAQIALAMSERIPVFGLFSDEGRTQAAMRLGVMLGVPLNEIEEHPETAGPKILELLAERSIHLLKPDNELATAKTVFDKASSLNQTCLVILDSVQTIPLDMDVEGESERVLYKKLMAYCRAKASEHGLIVLLTSQSNRASYRHKKREENSEAIASFAGTAAIEYLSDVGLVLGLPGEADEMVRVDVVKNRLKANGTQLGRSFHIRYDDATGAMLEVDQETLDSAELGEKEKAIVGIESLVLAEIKKHRNGLTRSDIEELIPRRVADVRTAVYRLRDNKRIFIERDGKKLLYRAELLD